jgi:hypothetical protein
MQIFRTQLSSSQPLTIVGGFIGSLVFISLLTVCRKDEYQCLKNDFCLKAISNFEMNTFGPNYQARILPEGKRNSLFSQNDFLFIVVSCLFISMICCAFVHRVCVTTW